MVGSATDASVSSDFRFRVDTMMRARFFFSGGGLSYDGKGSDFSFPPTHRISAHCERRAMTKFRRRVAHDPLTPRYTGGPRPKKQVTAETLPNKSTSHKSHVDVLLDGAVVPFDVRCFKTDVSITKGLSSRTYFSPPVSRSLPNGCTHLLREYIKRTDTYHWKLVDKMPRRQKIDRDKCTRHIPQFFGRSFSLVFLDFDDVVEQESQTQPDQSENGFMETVETV